MKICITGCAGFIGYHTALKLKEKYNYDVYGFDNINDYYDQNLKRARTQILKRKNVKFNIIDLKSKNRLINYFKNHNFDLVVHLGAYAGVRHSMVEPEKYITNNIIGTHNLIEACKQSNTKRVVYASTSCVMAGNPLPWKEDEKLGYQLNPYGYSKATNESQFMASQLSCAIGLRFFTVYGPWGRPDMALFDFTKNIIAGNPIKLFNNGEMIRDFTYIDDIVQGICLVVGRALYNNGIKDVYNIGYGQQVHLMDFVKHIENNLGRKAITEMAPKHPADTKETWSDTTKLQALGYKPTTPIEVGVKNFVEWYKNYYGVN
jgi:UDP-glucuronate 4-epimerase